MKRLLIGLLLLAALAAAVLAIRHAPRCEAGDRPGPALGHAFKLGGC